MPSKVAAQLGALASNPRVHGRPEFRSGHRCATSGKPPAAAANESDNSRRKEKRAARRRPDKTPRTGGFPIKAPLIGGEIRCVRGPARRARQAGRGPRRTRQRITRAHTNTQFWSRTHRIGFMLCYRKRTCEEGRAAGGRRPRGSERPALPLSRAAGRPCPGKQSGPVGHGKKTGRPWAPLSCCIPARARRSPTDHSSRDS